MCETQGWHVRCLPCTLTTTITKDALGKGLVQLESVKLHKKGPCDVLSMLVGSVHDSAPLTINRPNLKSKPKAVLLLIFSATHPENRRS